MNLFTTATAEELRAAYRIARRCNQWKTVTQIRLELATREATQ